MQLGHLGWSEEHKVTTHVEPDTYPAPSSASPPVLAAGTPGVVRTQRPLLIPSLTPLHLTLLHLHLFLYLGWSEHKTVTTRTQSDISPACSSAPPPVLAPGTPGVTERNYAEPDISPACSSAPLPTCPCSWDTWGGQNTRSLLISSLTPFQLTLLHLYPFLQLEHQG